jgi:hypothetical protein
VNFTTENFSNCVHNFKIQQNSMTNELGSNCESLDEKVTNEELVSCPQGCGDTMDENMVDFHLDMFCPKVTIACEDCKRLYPRQHEPWHHMAECDKHMSTCPLCEAECALKRMPDHLLLDCDAYRTKLELFINATSLHSPVVEEGKYSLIRSNDASSAFCLDPSPLSVSIAPQDVKLNAPLDARDCFGRWWIAKVVEEKNSCVRVRFLQWPPEWDEWYEKDSPRLAAFRTLADMNVSPLPKGSTVMVKAPECLAKESMFYFGKIVQVQGAQVEVNYHVEDKAYCHWFHTCDPRALDIFPDICRND